MVIRNLYNQAQKFLKDNSNFIVYQSIQLIFMPFYFFVLMYLIINIRMSRSKTFIHKFNILLVFNVMLCSMCFLMFLHNSLKILLYLFFILQLFNKMALFCLLLHSVNYNELFSRNECPNSIIKEITHFCVIEIYFTYSVNLDIIKMLIHNMIYLLLFLAGIIPMCKRIKLLKNVKNKLYYLIKKNSNGNNQKTFLDFINTIDIKIRYLYCSQGILCGHSLICVFVNLITPFLYNEKRYWEYSMTNQCCIIQIGLLIFALIFSIFYRARPFPESFNVDLNDIMDKIDNLNYFTYYFDIKSLNSSIKKNEKNNYKILKKYLKESENLIPVMIIPPFLKNDNIINNNINKNLKSNNFNKNNDYNKSYSYSYNKSNINLNEEMTENALEIKNIDDNENNNNIIKYDNIYNNEIIDINEKNNITDMEYLNQIFDNFSIGICIPNNNN